MKIAVIMAGHARSWDYCKSNFIENICHGPHQIDVFCETYNEFFRSDYRVNNECEMKISHTDDEIKNMFKEINVVNLGIESEKLGPSQIMHKRKLLKVFDNFLEYENNNGKYDLCIKHRFDILLDNKIDYEYILEECTKNSKLIFIGDGAVHMPENDMFAMTNSDTFKIYMNRLNLYQNENDGMMHHWSMREIQQNFGTVHSQTIGISIVRVDGNRKYKVEK
jgi:hypothetical protein